MRPGGRPILSITASQASMHWVQWMHSICSPWRMSMPVGQVTTQAPQSMQSPKAPAPGLSPTTMTRAPGLSPARVSADS